LIFNYLIHKADNILMNRPNQLTFIRIALTPFCFFLLLHEGVFSHQIASILFVIASLTDWYDGYIARRSGFVTRWGKFLDPLADKFLISMSLFAFVILNYIQLWMVIIIVLRDVLITALRSYALFSGKSIVTSNIAKWKTFSQMGLIYSLLIYLNLRNYGLLDSEEGFLGYVNLQNLLDKAALFVTLFTALTGAYYLIENRCRIKEMAFWFYRVFIPSDL